MALMARADIEKNESISVENLDFDFIVSDAKGNEIEYIRKMDIDIDVGETNDFEATVNAAEWSGESYGYKKRIYIPNTEYGGIIGDVESVTKDNQIILRGYTWRGLLACKIIEPPTGENNLILNGELNDLIRKLISDRFEQLFYVPEESTEITVSNYPVDRYTDIESAITKLLATKGMRLNIRYDQQKKAVELKAVVIADYSEEIEYSQDNKVDFDIRDCRTGVNHLICGGSGQGIDREIIHLYVQEDGSIGDTIFYTGLNEISAFYDYPNAENTEKLREDGISRLKELQNYKKMSMSVNDMNLELGDIVGGREYITNTVIKKPVVDKILKLSDGKIAIEYKLKGEE